MMTRLVLAVVLVCAALSPGWAARLGEDDVYMQVSSNAGDCKTCDVRITHVTRDLIFLEANNDWIGWAAYNEADDHYRGNMQWFPERGATYEGVLFDLTVRTDASGRLVLKAQSTKGTIETTYQLKGPFQEKRAK